MRKYACVVGLVLFVTLIPVLSKEICFKDGWMIFTTLGFKNQGGCIGYIHDQA